MTTQLISGIQKEYKKAFVLDEDGLRRVAGVLENAATTVGHPCTLVFHVKRDDDRFYETRDIVDVLNDPNVGDNRISLLGIELRNSDPQRKPEPWEKDFVAIVVFTRKSTKHVGVSIATENRNWALLLSDQIEPQLNRLFSTRKTPTWIIVSILILGISFFSAKIGGLCALGPVAEGFVPFIKISFWAGAIILGLTAAGSRPAWMRRIFGPEPVFLWGDEVRQHKERDDIRKFVFWGVVVAFVVAVAANLYTGYLLSFNVEPN